MAFDRRVPMPNGRVMGHHEVTRISHVLNGSTWVRVTSTEDGIEQHEWELPRELELGLGFEDAEEWVKNSDQFAEDKMETMEEDLAEAVANLDNVLDILTDEQAETIPLLYAEWKVDTDYAFGKRVRYDGKLYRCVQAHTSSAEYTPLVKALWTRTAAEGEIPDWVQPTGAQDAYNKGDKVRYQGKVWESTVNENVWAPGVYGWSEATE